MVLCNHPDLAYKRACMQAYNRWMGEYCAPHPDRLFGIGQTALRTPAEGIADLQEMKALGLRGVMLPGVPGEKDYDDPMWDPFWEAAIDLELRFARGDEMRTEISAKFDRSRVRAMLENCGFELLEWHTDPENLFALSVSRRRGS